MLDRFAGHSYRAIGAVLDQGFVGVLSLTALVMSARVLAPIDYAMFAVAYTLYLLLYAIHSSVLCEPILVFGHASRGARGSAVLKFVRTANSILATAGVFLLALSFAPLSLSPLATASLAAAGAALCSSLAWERRRLLYLAPKITAAPLQSALHVVLFCVLIVLLEKARELTPAYFFAALGISALIIGLPTRQLGSRVRNSDVSNEDRANARHDVAKYAVASLATAGAVWLASNLGYLILTSASALWEVSALRAAMNLILPWQQVTVGLGMLVTARVARQTDSLVSAGRVRTRMTGALALIGVAYGTIIWMTGPALLRSLYDGQYDHVASLLWLAPFLCGLWGAQGILASVARGMNRVGRILSALLAGNVIGWSVCLLFMPTLGASSIMSGIAILHGIAVVLLVREPRATIEMPRHSASSGAV